MLTARGADPRHVAFPAGHDPASLLRRDGRAALAGRLTAATSPLADVLVDERLRHLPPGEALPRRRGGHRRRPRRPVGQPASATCPAGCTSRPPSPLPSWSARSTGGTATATPPATSRSAACSRSATASPAQSQLTPMQRWAPLLRQVDPRLVRDDSWAPLAAAVDQADRAGHDVSTDLTRALAQGPLDREDPGADLKWRLLARPRTRTHRLARHPPRPSTQTRLPCRREAARPAATSRRPPAGPRPVTRAVTRVADRGTSGDSLRATSGPPAKARGLAPAGSNPSDRSSWSPEVPRQRSIEERLSNLLTLPDRQALFG